MLGRRGRTVEDGWETLCRHERRRSVNRTVQDSVNMRLPFLTRLLGSGVGPVVQALSLRWGAGLSTWRMT